MSMWDLMPAELRPRDHGLPSELRQPAAGAMSACWVCGVQPGKHDQAVAWAPLRPLDPRGPVDADQELLDQPWRRRHAACQPVAEWIVSELIGRTVEPAVARDVVASFAKPLTARGLNVTAGSPFGFLAQAERDRLAALVAMVEVAGSPAVSSFGRCGWCGVGRSAPWHRVVGVSWSDGSEARLCQDCAAVVPEDSSTLDDDDLRLRALAVFAGVNVSVQLTGFPLEDGTGRRDYWGFRTFAEVATADQRHDPDAERWQYGTGQLQQVRDTLRRLRPELIRDADERADGLARLDALRAEDAATRRPASSTPTGGVRW